MLRQLAMYLPVALAATLVACRNSDREPPAASAAAPRPADSDRPRPAPPPAEPPSTQPMSFTGTLQGNIMAIGAETTGWRIVGDGQSGGIEVDVSKVKDRAKSLEGKRVTVTGRITTRGYPERGHVQVLVADAIKEEPPRDPGQR